MFVAIGTSGTVYPANQFAAIAKASGAICVEINIAPTDAPFDQRLLGPATHYVPPLVDRLVQWYKHVRSGEATQGRAVAHRSSWQLDARRVPHAGHQVA